MTNASHECNERELTLLMNAIGPNRTAGQKMPSLSR